MKDKIKERKLEKKKQREYKRLQKRKLENIQRKLEKKLRPKGVTFRKSKAIPLPIEVQNDTNS
jgi:hypothetical protein